ncbi:MAG: hypothetical protein SGI84_03185 [Gemmatimonadota bacterium]|nr:hypothetical protein [Gemmatimonadota bacterium]
MSEAPMLFDAQPDEELGALLRQHLGGADEAAFVARLRHAVEQADRAESWEVLAGWARPGLVAAGLAAAAIMWVVLTRDIGPPSGPDVVPGRELIAGQPASGEILISAVLEGR